MLDQFHFHTGKASYSQVETSAKQVPERDLCVDAHAKYGGQAPIAKILREWRPHPSMQEGVRFPTGSKLEGFFTIPCTEICDHINAIPLQSKFRK